MTSGRFVLGQLAWARPWEMLDDIIKIFRWTACCFLIMHENGEHQVSKTMKAELQIILGQGQILFRVNSPCAKILKIDFQTQIWSIYVHFFNQNSHCEWFLNNIWSNDRKCSKSNESRVPWMCQSCPTAWSCILLLLQSMRRRASFRNGFHWPSGLPGRGYGVGMSRKGQSWNP